MEILKEGDRGFALASDRGKVPVVFEYRDFELDSGTVVPEVLVGIDEETDEILLVPAQSTPKIKAARDRVKDETLSVRIPSELDDILRLLSEHYHVNPSKFSPAVIRFYLSEATVNASLARRLRRLSQDSWTSRNLRSRLTVRSTPEFLTRVDEVAQQQTVSRSDLVRGVVVAAKQDVLDGRARKRKELLRSVAAAV